MKTWKGKTTHQTGVSVMAANKIDDCCSEEDEELVITSFYQFQSEDEEWSDG